MPQRPVPDWVLTRRRAIGMRIRAIRQASGLSQVQLGERIGRDHKSISRWENGHRTPSLDELILIADACNGSLADLVR